MNKELEEAIQYLMLMRKRLNFDKYGYVHGADSIDTVLDYIENSVSKKVIEENINILKQTPRKEFCNYDNYTYGGIRALERIIKVR